MDGGEGEGGGVDGEETGDRIMGAVEARRLLFLADMKPLFGQTYLHDHHMAIEGASAARLHGSFDMGTDSGDDGGAKGHVGHEMSIHDVDMEPVRSLPDLV